ncbi:alkylated DNA nucleotide flippase Atl1 [Agromyces ramosus]|uniref:Alkylated DNA nucleotide flippase Atl1 n=1 Tax=Agromyces ramosus TaxID=33879 RepID=A0A4Q7ME07_9MICO|nr:MGMT family protein [Agromyces ramosus]RZS66455.1 alkylated DNA nucleotide flippase Atl1 [Agromyces ramosus]
MSNLTERILHTVRAIPEGRAMTYGDIARATGTGARAVGRILHNGGHEIPWWRVVDADGRPYPAAADAVRAKFHEESTPLLEDSTSSVRVDLAEASWTPRDV